MFQFSVGLIIAFIIFCLVAEATSLWLIIAGFILAGLFVASAMVAGYKWANLKFPRD